MDSILEVILVTLKVSGITAEAGLVTLTVIKQPKLALAWTSLPLNIMLPRNSFL